MPAGEPKCFEFCFPNLDTLVQVEELHGDVVIRATRPTFSEQRKLCFIRELAAEGFIPDECRWFPLAGPGSFKGIRWLVDASWLTISPAVLAQTRSFVIRLLAGTGVVWV